MVVVDSSVWIDFFNDTPNPARAALRRLLGDGEVEIVVPDVVLFEVLRGFRGERDYRQAERLMLSLSVTASGGEMLALAAVRHDRALRAAGFTVRSGIDVLIAAFCIEHDQALLHRDADFDAFERLRGLRVWPH
jgi:predicted nucleic acid-binding protein